MGSPKARAWICKVAIVSFAPRRRIVVLDCSGIENYRDEGEGQIFGGHE